MGKETDITSIRIPKAVKEELKEVALEKEPYHATIQRIVNENQQLKKVNMNNEYLIDLMRKNTEDINTFYVGWEFLHRVITQYKTDANRVNALIEVEKIDSILTNHEKSYDEKIDLLQDAFNSSDDEISFVNALNYVLYENEYYRHTSEVELITDYVDFMQDNNPYDESTDEHQEYVALFNKVL